ncbi:hypothetical protein ABPG74_019944, partial [Tetrahymena malaccensis]
MLTQQQCKLVKSISKKLSQGYHISEISYQTFIQKMQQQNPFTQLQDYFNDQIQLQILNARSAKINKDIASKQLDCMYNQLKDSIEMMKEDYELLIYQKLIVKINQQSPQNSEYGTQSFLLKAETSQEKRNDQIQLQINKDIASKQKQLDSMYNQLQYSIKVMIKDNELLLIEKINQHSPQNSEYGAQSQVLKAEIIQEKREITQIQSSCSYEEIKYSIHDLLKEYDDVNEYLQNVRYQLQYYEYYEEYQMKKIDKMKVMLEEIIKKKKNHTNQHIINLYSQIEKNIRTLLDEELQIIYQNFKLWLYEERQQSESIQLLEQEKLINAQQAIGQDTILEKESKSNSSFRFQKIKQTAFNSAQNIKTRSEFDQKTNQYIDVQYPQKKEIQQKVNIQKYLSNINIKPDFNCIKVKLLGGSEKQKIQACQLDDQQIDQQIQYNQNYNEDRNFKIKEIEEQQNSYIYQFLIKSIQNSISLLNKIQTQSDQQEQKYQQNQNQQFNENENQNQNQLKDLITKTDNRKQNILEQDLDFIIGEQVNVYEIGSNESISNENESQNQNVDQLLLISKVDKSKQILKYGEYQFLSSIFKLGDYIISGGEADIFVNREEQVAFRVIKVYDDETLKRNLSELDNIKQFQEGHHILDILDSHVIENKFNKQKYIIHVMQLCQYSLNREYNKIKEYNLDQILNIIFTCLHFLIQLRQKYIYHSDIKPGNILKINDQYKLSDFGASKVININGPYVEADMYVEYYRPKNKVNQNLPFYHDIYSVAKTIDVLLNKFQSHETIKQELKKQIEELLQDNENSIEIDCFQLPNKFIDCLIDRKDSETKQFLERYLVTIEEYLIINKENKIFKYESQFQYAQIALKILKIENLNESIQINKIKLKALQTKSYILIKKQKYQEALECIQEILNSDELNSKEILISSITSLTKILIKKNQMVLLQEIYPSLVEFVQKNNKFEQILELQLKLFEIQLNSSSEFLPNQQYFDILLENIYQSNRLEMFYKLAIKYVKYLKHKNTYVDWIDELINFIKEDQANNTSYYRQKLIKKTCLYLDQFFFKNIILDIEFYWNYRNQIQNLISIIYNYLLSKYDQQFEVCFDEDIQDLCLILVNLKEIGFFDQEQIKEIDNLIQKYYDIFFCEITPLPYYYYYEQQYCYDLKCKFRQKYEQIKKSSSNKQNYLIQSYEFYNVAQYQSQEVNEQMQKILKVLNSTKIKLDKEICLTLNLDHQSDTISYSIKEEEEQNQISFEIKFNPNNKLNTIDRIFQIFNTTDLKRFQALRLMIEWNKIGEKGAQAIGRALEKCQNIIQLNLNLKNCILDQQEVIQLNTSLMECDQLECLTLNLQKEINTEDDISLLFNEDAFLKTLIQNSLDMSKNSYDQIYAAIQFLLKSFKVKSENQPKKLMIQGKTVLADGIPHFQNIKSLNLNLDGNQISDCGASVIGEALSSFRMLTNLNLQLWDNNIGDIGASSIGKGLSSCTELKTLTLNMSGNLIGDEGAFSIGTALSSCKMLTYLNFQLWGNQIGDKGASSIGVGLSTCTQLTTLIFNMSNNQIGDQGAIEIGLALSNFKKLTKLNFQLWENLIGNSGASQIGEGLSNCTQLLSLNFIMGGNQIEDQGCVAIGAALSSCKMLINLSFQLWCNRVGNIGASKIGIGLSKCTSLTNLDFGLSQNKIRDLGAFYIGLALASFKMLTDLTLWLWDNQIGERGTQRIGEGLSNCTQLKTLDFSMSKNLVGNQGACSIGTALSNFKNLTKLNFQFWQNEIGDIGLHQIGVGLSNCPQLNSLDMGMSLNNIRDIGVSAIGEALISQKMLTNLDIDLWQNDIGEDGGSNLGIGLIRCSSQLLTLNLVLNENSIGDLGASFIGTALSSCKMLGYLKFELENNQISDIGAQNIGVGLSNCTQLKKLKFNMGSNQISDQGASAIGIALSNCKMLRLLNLQLQENNIGDIGASHIGLGLSNCDQLTTLIFCFFGNQIGEEGASAIGKALQNCKMLNSLHLWIQRNKIQDKGASNIAAGLSNCCQLTNLFFNMSNNQFGDEGASAIGLSLCNFKLLTKLELDLSLAIMKISDIGISNISAGLSNNISLTTLDFTL